MNNDNKAIYSDNKRIPAVEKTPEGLVFKVQIGAFRNPIPQSHFKGFAPIMTEDAGNGITRYTAGLFTGVNMAVEAKNAIRSIGYSDAFVVAFYNGKRISIAEARTMADNGAVAENNSPANNTTPIVNENETAANNNATETNSNEEPNSNEPPVVIQPTTEEVKDGVSTDVRNITGVFYAIQVGVYSKPVSSGQLNNVSPLNSERLAGGLIRYTSGVFKTLAEANTAKDRIRSLGITDAFVVAYNGGQKITVASANDLLSSNTAPVITEEPVVVEEPIKEEPVVLDDPAVNDGLDIEFKVKLGEYEEDVPIDDAALFLKLSGRGVKNYEEGDKTIYTLGSFKDYQSALDTQIEMQEMGVKDPETVAYKNGKEITIEEALELIDKNN